jgi:hypothetical protein
MIFKELTKYKTCNHFQFGIDTDLATSCNASTEGSGVFLVYSMDTAEKELLFIGSTGTVHNNGDIKHRAGGIADRIVNGTQFGKMPRRIAWPLQMKKENRSTLEIHWFETFNNKHRHIPTYVEGLILQKYLDVQGCLPKWNIAF